VCLFSPLYIFFSPLFFIFYCTLLHFPMSLSIFLTFHLMQQVLRLNIRLDFTQLVKWIYFSRSPFLSSFFFLGRDNFFLGFHSISCSDFHFYILGILPFTPYCYYNLQFFNTWVPSWVKHSQYLIAFKSKERMN